MIRPDARIVLIMLFADLRFTGQDTKSEQRKEKRINEVDNRTAKNN